MTRLLSILTLIMALVALSAPSVSLGTGIRLPVWVSASNDSVVSEMVSDRVVVCQLLGGKRVLPCHPDLGVMTASIAVVRPLIGHQLPRGMAPAVTTATPEAELPPPKLG